MGIITRARTWLKKYNDVDKSSLPPGMRGFMLGYRILQPVLLVAAIAWTFLPTMEMMYVSLGGVIALFVLGITVEPVLDRAVAKIARDAEVQTGTPLERAKKKYLSLPDNDPRLEAAKKAYLDELKKETPQETSKIETL